jgi:hypothetical protein
VGDPLGSAPQSEAAEADRIAATAVAVASGAISTTTMVVARLAVRSVQDNAGKGALGEPAADLRRLRSSADLMQALSRDLALAQAQAGLLLQDALWMGYRAGLDGRSAGLPVVAEATEEDRAELVSYPVLGHTTAEVAASLVDRLRYEVDGALAQPLTGTIDPAAIPPALAVVGAAHGQRVGDAVRESFHAGVQAAVRAIGAALVGAA